MASRKTWVGHADVAAAIIQVTKRDVRRAVLGLFDLVWERGIFA